MGGLASPDTNDTPTLDLPRILCLHGGGTNATIFRMQCRVLEKRLGQSYRFVYAQAPFVSLEPGPDVTSVYQNFGPFRVWLRDHRMGGVWTSRDVAAKIDASLAMAMTVDDAAGATGEWAGILGFSQGAKIAASVMYRQQRAGMDTFKFAVLVAGRGPLVWLMPDLPQPRGLVDAATPFTYDPPAWLTLVSDEHMLRLPTIHVHGLQDPNLDKHRALLREYCDPHHAALVEWDGDHRMPIKTRDVEALAAQIFRAAREGEAAPEQYDLAMARKNARYAKQPYTRVAGVEEAYVHVVEERFSLQRISIYTKA